ncbi:MAG: CYTH domain-containing protein [archaeon]|jgi:adenylate cyclase class 2
MKELEVKVIEINKIQVIKKLVSLGAKKIAECDVSTTVFDTPKKDFHNSNKTLRLRKKGKYYLTLKEHKAGKFAKEDDEYEVEVSDFSVMKTLLEKVGLVSEELKPSHRITYKLENSLVEIQEFKEIPPYFEVESPNEKELRKILDLLEVDKSKVRNWNGWELFSHYKIAP